MNILLTESIILLHSLVIIILNGVKSRLNGRHLIDSGHRRIVVVHLDCRGLIMALENDVIL